MTRLDLEIAIGLLILILGMTLGYFIHLPVWIPSTLLWILVGWVLAALLDWFIEWVRSR